MGKVQPKAFPAQMTVVLDILYSTYFPSTICQQLLVSITFYALYWIILKSRGHDQALSLKHT